VPEQLPFSYSYHALSDFGMSFHIFKKKTMKSRRFQKYLAWEKSKGTGPIKKEDVQKNPDKHIDQDFPGYPNNPSKEAVIKPSTSTQKKTAAVKTKDGEKKTKKTAPQEKGSEQDSEGSGGAFAATEEVHD